VTGKKVPYDDHPRRPGDPPVLVGDAGRAKNVLGWKTGFPDLEKIVETAWKFESRRS